MIRTVRIDRGPLSPGETRFLIVDADGPLQIHIKCFSNDPPPPGYKPCRECGAFTAESGESIQITASRSAFGNAIGHISVEIIDTSDADVTYLDVEVDARDGYSAPTATA